MTFIFKKIITINQHRKLSWFQYIWRPFINKIHTHTNSSWKAADIFVNENRRQCRCLPSLPFSIRNTVRHFSRIWKYLSNVAIKINSPKIRAYLTYEDTNLDRCRHFPGSDKPVFCAIKRRLLAWKVCIKHNNCFRPGSI